LRVWGVEFTVQGIGLMVSSSGLDLFLVSGHGRGRHVASRVEDFRVKGSELRVKGLGFIGDVDRVKWLRG